MLPLICDSTAPPPRNRCNGIFLMWYRDGMQQRDYRHGYHSAHRDQGGNGGNAEGAHAVDAHLQLRVWR